MGCLHCDHCTGIPTGLGTVFLGATVPELMTKLIAKIQSLPWDIRATDGCLTGTVPDFDAFLTALNQVTDWSFAEKANISALFVKQPKELSFRTALETRTLAEWEELRGAQFLSQIIDQKRLLTYFHPIWEVANHQVFGWECLMRGLDADDQLVPPGKLLAAARSAGLIFPLDRLARLTALETAHASGLQGSLFINFLPTAIYDPEYCLRSTVALAESLGLQNHQIVFEVVETEQIADWQHLQTIVSYYRQKGFKIALDDVGSGYSSLNLLANLKPDILKIDLEIIRHIDTDPIKQSVFRALATIARENRITLLAEGIETQAELDFVAAGGADLAQGFLWGPPGPARVANPG